MLFARGEQPGGAPAPFLDRLFVAVEFDGVHFAHSVGVTRDPRVHRLVADDPPVHCLRVARIRHRDVTHVVVQRRVGHRQRIVDSHDTEGVMPDLIGPHHGAITCRCKDFGHTRDQAHYVESHQANRGFQAHRTVSVGVWAAVVVLAPTTTQGGRKFLVGLTVHTRFVEHGPDLGPVCTQPDLGCALHVGGAVAVGAIHRVPRRRSGLGFGPDCVV